MKIENLQAFSKLPRHDLTLKNISWPKDNENNLTITNETYNGDLVEFKFEWVMNLNINLSLGDYAQAMSWDIEADIDSKGIWKIQWIYPGIGFIYLECNEVEYKKL